jgi:hypothetical protein
MPNITLRYYPVLSSFVQAEDLLKFKFFKSLENELTDLLDSIYVQDYFYKGNEFGSKGYYSFKVISKRLSLALV